MVSVTYWFLVFGLYVWSYEHLLYVTAQSDSFQIIFIQDVDSTNIYFNTKTNVWLTPPVPKKILSAITSWVI